MSDIIGVVESSMIGDMQRLDTISNNLANVSTPGFKRDIAVTNSFESVLLDAQQNIENQNQLSRSVDPNTNVVDERQGALKYTGNALDVAIEGDGYFEVKKGGETFLTRQGTFTLDSRGTLVTPSGLAVQGSSGEIRLTTSNPRIDQQGKIWNGKDMVEQLAMVQLPANVQLKHVGGGLYQSAGGNYREISGDQVNIRQGYFETSNVKTNSEMVQMIEVMRHFETSQRVVKSYDDLLDTAIRSIGDL